MSEKLRIGFVSLDDAKDVASWSGVPYHVLDALKRQDVSIEVFSPLQQNFRYLLAPIKIAARLSKRDVFINHFPLAMRSCARQLKQRMLRNPVDVILATSSMPITLLECSVPIIFYTDAVFHMMPGYYGGLWDRLTARSIERGKWQEERALRNCTLGVSNWAAEGARKYTQPDKIRVVPFGASVPVHHEIEILQEWVSQRLTGAPSECRLLFIGVDWVRKGGAFAIETARILNKLGVRTKLTVIGCQPNGEVPDFVEVLGFVDKRSAEGRKQIEELYRHATFFILPTSAEAAGIVYCEASAFGVPTFTFKTGGSGDYIREGVNGMCLPLDSKPEVFAQGMKDIIESEDRYSALCLGAFNEYKTRLNWDHTAGALVDLCREAVQAI
jgi:glycosyltransferase involved in cell wall biosynthesis